jgi:hypothetical protein
MHRDSPGGALITTTKGVGEMKPKNEIEVAEYTRDKKIADPNSLVLDGDSEVETPLPIKQESPRHERFNWHEEADHRIIVHHQPAIAVHTDPIDGSVVVRQEDFFGEVDQIVYFQPEFADKVVQAILAFAKRAE